MQVNIVDDIADDHRIAGGRVPRYPVTILPQHLDHKGLLLLPGGDFTGGEQIIVIKGIKVKGVHLGPLCLLAEQGIQGNGAETDGGGFGMTLAPGYGYAAEALQRLHRKRSITVVDGV